MLVSAQMDGIGERGPLRDPARVLDALAVGVIVHDSALRIVYANSAAALLLGVETHEALERDVADPRWVVLHTDGSPVPPTDVPASVALRTRKPVRGMVLGVRQHDGVTTWITVDGVPLLNADGEVEFVAVSISDVARELVPRLQLERVRDSLGRTIQERDAAVSRAVQALDSSEARYRAVLRAMSEGVAVHAADGGILFANPAAERILGITLEQMQGRHPVDTTWRLTDATGAPLPPEQIPSEITRRTGEPQRNTLLGVQRGSSGEHAWLSVSTDPIGLATEPQNEGGSSVVATFTDVTSERTALAAAQQARDHLRDITAALPGVVMEYLVRDDGGEQFRYVSDPVREYFGIEASDALQDSAHVWSRVHPEDRESTRTGLRPPHDGSEGVQLEFRVLHSDGSYHYARLRSGPATRVPEGLLSRLVVLDVTEQRRLEETVREAQRREAIGTLAAGMAHNFNNMLAVIMPSLEMISDASPDLKADLEDARTATHAATELVRQLMQLVRKETTGSASVVNLSKMVDEIAQMCRRTFDASIEIRCVARAAACNVLARPAELQQLLVNLCINARDALEGRPHPLLEMHVEAERDVVVIQVRDNGAGMSPETQRRLGEPFFSTKPPGRGTGLGLATAYGIVAELRGSLECVSSPGQGTRFELRLPRHDAAAEAHEGAASEHPSPAGLRVLVIDDEELVRATLQRALERMGSRVLSASNGGAGLELLRAHPETSLVLLDLAMPDASGEHILRRLREFAPDVPVYIMTGFLPDGLDLRAANGVLTKPVEIARVRALLREVAARKGDPRVNAPG